MTKYCTITPTRGDRPELFQYCLTQLKKMCKDQHLMNAYLITEKPKSDHIDLVQRIKQGYEMAKRDGFEYVFIIEDDDYYPKDYLSNLVSTASSSNADFIGYDTTVYYNLINRTWQTFTHKERSSLFCTGFKVSALDRFNWPNDNYTFMDIRLWEYANRSCKNITLLKDNPALGVKHNIGKTGGKAHRMVLQNEDKNLEYLQSRVDAEAFEFYKQLINKL